MAIPPSSSSPSPLPPTDKETNLAEQAQRINNEPLLERQLRVADAARKALEEEGGRFTIRLKLPTDGKIPNPLGGEELEEFEEDIHIYTHTAVVEALKTGNVTYY